MADRSAWSRTALERFGAPLLLFLVFPPAQGSVGSVVGRCDVLALLFVLLGWRSQILWERGTGGDGPAPGATRAAFSVGLLGLVAMLGKESGAIFPALVVLTS